MDRMIYRGHPLRRGRTGSEPVFSAKDRDLIAQYILLRALRRLQSRGEAPFGSSLLQQPGVLPEAGMTRLAGGGGALPAAIRRDGGPRLARD